MLSIGLETIDQDDVTDLLRRSDARSQAVYPTVDRRGPSQATLAQQGVRFFVARLDGTAVGCGGYVRHQGDAAELKRMFIDANARGRGIGQALLQAIERAAMTEGVLKMRLETGVLSVEARGLYTRSGYSACGPFGDYGADPQSVFMEKDLS